MKKMIVRQGIPHPDTHHFDNPVDGEPKIWHVEGRCWLKEFRVVQVDDGMGDEIQITRSFDQKATLRVVPDTLTDTLEAVSGWRWHQKGDELKAKAGTLHAAIPVGEQGDALLVDGEGQVLVRLHCSDQPELCALLFVEYVAGAQQKTYQVTLRQKQTVEWTYTVSAAHKRQAEDRAKAVHQEDGGAVVDRDRLHPFRVEEQ